MSEAPPPGDEAPGGRRPTARLLAGASLWAVFGLGGRQALRLGSNLIFTRLLFPEAFGLMAIVNSIRTGLEMLSDLGIAPSIVQSRRGTDPTFLDTAWSFQIARGGVVFVITLALAVPVARLYGAPELTGLLPLAGLAVLLASFNSTQLALLQRAFSVRTFESIQIAGQVSSVVTILIWLWFDRSVWALIAGSVVASSVRLGLSHVVAERRDRMRWDPVAARELFDFGKWIFVSTVLTFVADEADRLLFGKLASLEELGVYSIALLFATLPALLVRNLGTLVLFPALSRSRERGPELAPLYRRLRRPLIAFGAVLVACLAAGAIPLIGVLYDPRYHAAGWMLQLLAVGGWFQVLEVSGRSGLLALGQTRWMAALNGVKLIGVVVGIPVGFAAYGFPGGIAALVLADAARYLVCTIGAARHGLGASVGDLGVSALVAAAAGAGALLAQQWTAAGTAQWWTLLASMGATGALVAPVALFLLHRSRALELLRPDVG